jgi:hypothetical protein
MHQKIYKLVLKTFRQMKKTWLYFVLTIILVSSAYAACYDSDDGPKNLDQPARYIGTDGFVTEGNTTYYDTCVNREGGNEVNDSNWVREYYCDHNGNMDYEDYFCPSYHYVECLTFHKSAACDDYSGPSDYNETNTSTTTTTNTTNTTNTTTTQNTTTTITTPENCGDGKVNLDEECDPPGKECYTKSFLSGVCNFNCVCDSSLTMDLFKKLNNTLKQEETEENKSASITFEVNDTEPEVVENISAPEITGAVSTDHIDDLIKTAREPPEDFSDSFGIKITSAITRNVMKVWNLLMNLIGG